MFDVNPLGPDMHLRQLEREMAGILRSRRLTKSRVANPLSQLLRRLKVEFPSAFSPPWKLKRRAAQLKRNSF